MNTPEYKPTKEEELFIKYHERLIWELISAHDHLKLWKRLENYKSNYLRELNQAPHFFQRTIKAHFDDALLTLAKILDIDSDAITIWKLLNFAEQNKDILSTQSFQQRRRHEPNYDEYWVESHVPITLKEIQEHKAQLAELENVINNIKGWRDKVIAHIDRDFHIKGKSVAKEYPLEIQQLQKVIDTLHSILDRYSNAYKGSTWIIEYVGADDVQYVMDSIRFHVQERKAQLETAKRQAYNKGKL